jgi:hypothetical protein
MPGFGDSFQIIEVSGTWSGQFGTFNLPTLSSGLAWDLSDLYSSGTIGIAQAVPEPGSGLLLAAGLFALVTLRNRRRA